MSSIAKIQQVPVEQPSHPIAASLKNASVKFGAFTAIDGMSIDIEQGGFYTILGV